MLYVDKTTFKCGLRLEFLQEIKYQTFNPILHGRKGLGGGGGIHAYCCFL